MKYLPASEIMTSDNLNEKVFITDNPACTAIPEAGFVVVTREGEPRPGEVCLISASGGLLWMLAHYREDLKGVCPVFKLLCPIFCTWNDVFKMAHGKSESREIMASLDSAVKQGSRCGAAQARRAA
jgi:hypothetical protein